MPTEIIYIVQSRNWAGPGWSDYTEGDRLLSEAKRQRRDLAMVQTQFLKTNPQFRGHKLGHRVVKKTTTTRVVR